MKLNTYLKAISGAVIAGLGSLQIAYIDNVLSTQEIITIAIVAITALAGIWAVPNAPKRMTPEEVKTLEMQLGMARATVQAKESGVPTEVENKPPVV